MQNFYAVATIAFFVIVLFVLNEFGPMVEGLIRSMDYFFSAGARYLDALAEKEKDERKMRDNVNK